jgi:hypothetical protein
LFVTEESDVIPGSFEFRRGEPGIVHLGFLQAEDIGLMLFQPGNDNMKTGADRVDIKGCYFDVNRSFDEFALDVKNSLNLKFTKNIKAQEYIKTAVLTTGSGASLIPKIEADCFLSGDMKYHDSLSAKERGLSIIDIGHYESEIYFADILDKELKIKNIFAIIANSRNPFSY